MNPRPTSATIIGWLFIGVSSLMIVSGAMGAVAWSLFPSDFRSEGPDLSGEPGAFRFMFSMFDYYEYLVAVQCVLAVAGLVGGIGLLRLRPWARALTEILTWLGLVYTVLFSAVWLASVGSMGHGDIPSEAHVFFVFMLVVGTLAFICIVVPYVVVLVALRGRTIREAIQERCNSPFP